MKRQFIALFYRDGNRPTMLAYCIGVIMQIAMIALELILLSYPDRTEPWQESLNLVAVTLFTLLGSTLIFFAVLLLVLFAIFWGTVMFRSTTCSGLSCRDHDRPSNGLLVLGIHLVLVFGVLYMLPLCWYVMH